MVRSSAVNVSLETTKAVVLLDSDGKRILAKYYSPEFHGAKEQKAFEKSVFEKTKRSAAGEVLLLDSNIISYRNVVDVWIYFVGSTDENELMISSILASFIDALCGICRTQIEKRVLMENLDAVMLALDETIDDGIILESDPTIIAARVTKRPVDQGFGDIPLNEQTISQALAAAKEQLARSLLK